MQKMNPKALIIHLALMATLCGQTPPAASPAPAAEVSTGAIFLDDSDDALGAVSSAAAAKRDAEKYIADKGWNLGFNDQGRYVVVGTSDIAGEPSSPSFQAARQSGYGKALLDAKEQVAMLYSQKVATETMYGSEKSASNPENFAAPAAPSKEPAPLSIYQKIKLLIHARLDEALKNKGIEPKQATKEQIKAVETAVLTTEFRRTITRMAAAEVGALITQKIFEDGNSIAVVAYYTPRTKELMDAMLGKGPAPKSKPQETPVAKWINNFTKAELYASQGVQIRVDENGDANLIAFGQTPVTINSTLGAKVAEGAAVTVAMGAMRDFAGEFVEAEIKQQIVERSKQYGDMDKGLAEVEQDMAIKEKIKARADALTIQGVTPPIRTWTTKDTRSGRILTGVVVSWNIANAKRANQDRQDFNNSAGSKGGDGTATNDIKASSKPSAAPSKQTFDPTKKVNNKVQSKEADPF
jgi:hypothetical protein